MKHLSWSFSSLGISLLVTALGSSCSDGDDANNAVSPGGQTGVAGGAGGASGGGAGSGGAGGSGGSGPVATAPWDYIGIIGTGQSLSVGAEAGAITEKARLQSFNNLKLSLGAATVPPYNPDDAALSLVPLLEPIRATANGYPRAYPQNLYGESPHTAMASQMTALATAGGLSDFVTIHTVVGESGQGMSVINKTAVANDDPANGGITGHAYAASLFEVQAIKRLAGDKSYGIGAIFLTHGETDAGNANYENDMLQLWTDYNADLRAITGQEQEIPLFTSQQHGIYMYATGNAPRNVDTSTLLQWKAGLDHPGQIVCTGPKYQYPYADDWLHLQPLGYELMGEKYAEIFYSHVVLGQPWQPLQPLGETVTRAGRVITVDFHVPFPPLAWDEALPRPHQADLTEWAQGRGFEVRVGATRLAIESVEILDEDTVQITCAADVPAGATLGYAAQSDGAAVQNVSPRWGQLKDSDPFVGQFTQMPQANYSVTFELPVP
ncbi:MAG TPA: dockerin [Polyangiaceae bacterium]|nr:dockerin [Polyangiaceae bacterium]